MRYFRRRSSVTKAAYGVHVGTDPRPFCGSESLRRTVEDSLQLMLGLRAGEACHAEFSDISFAGKFFRCPK